MIIDNNKNRSFDDRRKRTQALIKQMYPKVTGIKIEVNKDNYIKEIKEQRIGNLKQRFDKLYSDTLTQEDKAKAVILLELEQFEFQRDLKFTKFIYRNKVLQNIMDVIRTILPSKIIFWHFVFVLLFLYFLFVGLFYLRTGDVCNFDLIKEISLSNSIILLIYRFLKSLFKL